MNWFWLITIILVASGCHTERFPQPHQTTPKPAPLGRIAVASNGRGFVNTESGQPFHPWGMNYGNNGRLMEDFWNNDWETIAKDFQDMKAMEEPSTGAIIPCYRWAHSPHQFTTSFIYHDEGKGSQTPR